MSGLNFRICLLLHCGPCPCDNWKCSPLCTVWTHCCHPKDYRLRTYMYILTFTFRMPCSSEISIQWLLRLVVDVAASSCQWTVWLDTCAAGAQLSVVAGRSGCRSVSFSFPTYVGCMSSCSGHFWVGSLKPIHHEIVLGSFTYLEIMIPVTFFLSAASVFLNVHLLIGVFLHYRYISFVT